YFYKNKPLTVTEIRNNTLKKKISTIFLRINNAMAPQRSIKFY
ncbi:hypothetical protein HMPREF9088_2383, partial [Enterococcus italicus DSM 15952]